MEFSRIDDIDKTPYTLFDNQMETLSDSKIKRSLHKRYITIDSSKRAQHNHVVSKKIETIDKYLKIQKNHLQLIIVNPSQLTDEKDLSPTPHAQVVFRWIQNGSQDIPKKILGIASHNLLFNEDIGTPIFEIELLNYHEEMDRGYYGVKGVCSLKGGGIWSGHILPDMGNLEVRVVEKLEKGYPDPNHYQLHLQHSFKNVVSVKLVSSIFPIPQEEYNNIKTLDLFVDIQLDKDKNDQGKTQRNIFLPLIHIQSHQEILDILIEKLCQSLHPLGYYPILTTDLQSYYRINILYRLIDTHTIEIHNYTTQTIIIQAKMTYHLSVGSVVYLNLKDESRKGIYRVHSGYEYKLQIEQPNLIHLGDSLYLNGILQGKIIRIENETIYLVSNHPLRIDSSQVLETGDKEVVGIEDYQFLGKSSLDFLDKIASLPLMKPVLQEEGLYILEEYKLKYTNDSILSVINPVPNNRWVYSVSNYPPCYEKKATISIVGEHTANIQFSKEEGNYMYQVIAIVGEMVNQEDSYQEFLPSILSSPNDDGRMTRVIIDNDQYSRDLFIEEGMELQCHFKHKAPQYVPIYEREENSVLLPILYEKKNTITGMSRSLGDSGIRQAEPHHIFLGHLLNGVIRGEQSLTLYLMCEQWSTQVNSFIIQIGNPNDNPDTTNCELNIIETNQIDNGQREINLKFPIVNSWLAGTPVYLKYLYLEVQTMNHILDKTIKVESRLELDKIINPYGILNWNTFYLYDDNDNNATLYQENMNIEEINYLGEDQYQLVISPLEGDYHPDDETYYLVLFVSPDLVSYPPSTLIKREAEEWMTHIYLSNTQSYKIGDSVIIYGMKSEMTPIFGLSQNDKISRDILDRDLLSHEEVRSEILRKPNEWEKHLIKEKGDNYISIKGRFMGYGGRIRKLEKNQEINIDLTLSHILANPVNHTYQAFLDTHLLPSHFIQSIMENGKNKNSKTPTKEIDIRVRPIPYPPQPTNKGISYKDNHYFYMTSNILGHIIDIPKIDKKTQSLQGWSVMSHQADTRDKLLTQGEALSHQHQLKHIFNVVNIKKTPQNDYLSNTFLPIEKVFYPAPIPEIYQLDFTFIWKDGRLVDFRGQDHSFTLEIIELDGSLDEINPRTGQVYHS